MSKRTFLRGLGLPTGGNEGHKYPWRNCHDKLGRNGNHDLLLAGALQIHGTPRMLEEEEDSGTGMSGMSNEQYADDEHEEFASCCSDNDISEDCDDGL